MKKLFILIFAVCFSLMVSAQTKTYVNQEPYFKFTYPSCYNKINIQSAPHMVLKLEKDKGESYCALSVWDIDIPSYYDIWDDVIYDALCEKVKSFYVNGKINIQKKYAAINGSNIKTIEYNIISYIDVPGSNRLPVYTTICELLHKGYMIQVSFTYSKNFNASLQERNRIMKGLKL